MSKAALAVSMVLMLSLPAHIRDRSWFQFQRDRIVKVAKRVVKSLGDGLTVPTP